MLLLLLLLLLMKLLKTNNLETVAYCRIQYNFDLPRSILRKKTYVFARKYKMCNNLFCIHL